MNPKLPALVRQSVTVLAVTATIGSISARTFAQTPAPTTQTAPDPTNRTWHAAWITHPTSPLREPIVLHFRRALTLAAVPANYPVRVSADNRFILYVNGHRVGTGPARGDLAHWRYERFDLAPYLRPGQNLITATVWNFGIYAPLAQISDRTAFLLESEIEGPTAISTRANGSTDPKDGWLVELEPGHRPIPRPVPKGKNGFWDYMAAGFGEEINASQFDWKWNDGAPSGSAWLPAASPMREVIYPRAGDAHSSTVVSDNTWCLVEDLLPHMEDSPTEPGKVVRVDPPAASKTDFGSFPASPIVVPPGSQIHILLDRKALTTAYPLLTTSGGKGAKITFTYAEALYDQDHRKGDRDEIAGRTAVGVFDRFLPDGGQHRTFEPLWWREWRYLDLDIETADDPLTLESLTARFTAYPFVERASFHSPDPELDKIWEISWRTARINAHETYMDAPYYEQLQYLGDTRVQALISYAVAGDGLLARQAIDAFDQSRIPDGITLSRYPASLPQPIPTFSLIYVGMVHDYWMYRPDADFVRTKLPGTRTVLDWFARYEQPDGLLKKVPGWSFVDWVLKGEIPTYDANGESCMTTLHYLGALDDAADLEHALGDPVFADRDRARANHVRTGLLQKCWSPERRLLADNPALKDFSQQANILAVLYDVIPHDQQAGVLNRILTIEPGTTPDGVLSASYYFRFYLGRALDHAGLGDKYLASISPWRKLLPLHFSTWPEAPGDTRSDSHAWSAHPIYDLLSIVAGIEPASPGFGAVRIAPNLGDLPSLTAQFPHPQGLISVDYRWTPERVAPGQRGGSTFHARITLPGSLTGRFELGGSSWPLHPGENNVDVPMK
jgi:hypothetical protein